MAFPRVSPPMTYVLAEHVYLAVVGGDVVLLDARADRYACIAACDAAPLVEGAAARRWGASDLASELEAARWFTRSNVVRYDPGSPPPLPNADIAVRAEDVVTASAFDIVGALYSGTKTAIKLKRQTPDCWLSRYRAGPTAPGTVAAARLFAQAILYVPQLDRCLPRTLALLDFLARRGHCAQLVFGVRTHPFEAHCWAQAGGLILNDTVARTRWYTPIAWS